MGPLAAVSKLGVASGVVLLVVLHSCTRLLRVSASPWRECNCVCQRLDGLFRAQLYATAVRIRMAQMQNVFVWAFKGVA